MIRLVVAGGLVVALLGGCQGAKEDPMDLQQRAEARAAEARGYIDDLVLKLDGTSPEVDQDDLVDCEPGDSGSGLDLVYNVRFGVDAGGIDRLQGPIAEEMEAEGWTVRRDPVDQGLVSVRFLRGTFSVGAAISMETGNATAGGSGGCVE